MRTAFPARVLMIVLIVAAAFSPGCSMFVGFKAKSQQTVTAAHVPQSGLEVTTENGSVEVTADPSAPEVVVVASITAGGDSQEEADQRAALVQIEVVRTPEGTLHVSPIYPDSRRSGDSCSFQITVPDARGPVIRSSNGRIVLVGLDGDASARTSNGSIRVERQGGGVKAHTSNGRVEVVDAGGALDVETSNGSVDIQGLRGAAVVKTSNGRVACRVGEAVTDPIQIRTSNGSVTLVVPASAGGSIDATTSNGSVSVSGSVASVEGTKKHRLIRLAGEGPASTVRTSNGGISVVVEGEAAESPDQ